MSSLNDTKPYLTFQVAHRLFISECRTRRYHLLLHHNTYLVTCYSELISTCTTEIWNSEFLQFLESGWFWTWQNATSVIRKTTDFHASYIYKCWIRLRVLSICLNMPSSRPSSWTPLKQGRHFNQWCSRAHDKGLFQQQTEYSRHQRLLSTCSVVSQGRIAAKRSAERWRSSKGCAGEGTSYNLLLRATLT